MFHTNCNCIGRPPCVKRRGYAPLKTFGTKAQFDAHNNKYHWNLTFNPESEIRIPNVGWKIIRESENRWIIERKEEEESDEEPALNDTELDIQLDDTVPPLTVFGEEEAALEASLKEGGEQT
mmetsp:Transcript_19137/g.26336  ORF Transcript_19137/g.26336 Transcript_19137/m.26336 type:complete len:122 (-) Transcript_19137:261-626(-)